MMGSGGMIVMDEDTCMVDTARYYMNFLAEESCGKCVPCREGIHQMLTVLDRIMRRGGPQRETSSCSRRSPRWSKGSPSALWAERLRTRCSAPSAISRDEYEAHINEKRCPGGVCKALISYYIDPEKCQACMACLKNCPTGAITGARTRSARDRPGQVHQVRRLLRRLPVALQRGGRSSPAFRCPNRSPSGRRSTRKRGGRDE